MSPIFQKCMTSFAFFASMVSITGVVGSSVSNGAGFTGLPSTLDETSTGRFSGDLGGIASSRVSCSASFLGVIGSVVSTLAATKLVAVGLSTSKNASQLTFYKLVNKAKYLLPEKLLRSDCVEALLAAPACATAVAAAPFNGNLEV